MILHNWAVKHGVSLEALQDLRQQMGALDHDSDLSQYPDRGVSEEAVQARERLAASNRGGRYWRNNVGALKDKSGRMIRFGLANDSAKLNDLIKSADLIGINPILITSAHVGTVIGQFDSAECKAVGWTYSGTEHEIAQLQWINLVISLGGRARFTTGE